MDNQNFSDDFLRKSILFALYDSKIVSGGIDYQKLAERVHRAYIFKDLTSKQKSRLSAKIREELVALFTEKVIDFNFVRVNDNFVITKYSLRPDAVDNVRYEYQTAAFNAFDGLTDDQKTTFIRLFSDDKYLGQLDRDKTEKYADYFEAFYKANLIYPYKACIQNGNAVKYKWSLTGLGWNAMSHLFKNTSEVFKARAENLNETYFERYVMFGLYECAINNKLCDIRLLCGILNSKVLFYNCKSDTLLEYVNKTLKSLVAKKQADYDIVENTKDNSMKVVYKLTPEGMKTVAPVYEKTVQNKTERLNYAQIDLLSQIQEKEQNEFLPFFKEDMNAQEIEDIKYLLNLGLVRQCHNYWDRDAYRFVREKNWRLSFEGSYALNYLDNNLQDSFQSQQRL